MDIIDQLRKKKEATQEQSTPPPRGHTLTEILGDKSNSHLFGRFLEKDGHQDLAGRLVAGNLEEDDIELLEEQRLKFSEKMTQSEKIEKLVNKDTVVEIARNHPEFAKIINLLGPEKAVKAIRSQLKEIRITDEDRFNKIAEPIEAHEDYKNGAYKETNKKVETLCKEMGISPEEYLDAIAIQDPKEKKAALRKLARGKHGKFATAWNFVMGTEGENLKSLTDAEESLEEALAKLATQKEAVGDALFLGVSDNDDMRNALTRELLSEHAPAQEPKPGFGDAKRQVLGGFSEKEMDTDWQAYKRHANFDTETDFRKEVIRDMFLDEQKEKYKKKIGKREDFWAKVFAALSEGKIDSKRDSLQ